MKRLWICLAAAFWATLAAAQTLSPQFPPGVFDNTAALSGSVVAPSNMTTPIFLTPAGSAPTANTTQYAPFGSAGSWNSSVSARQSAWPIAGTISNLNVFVAGTAITTNAYVFTLNIAGSNTALVCSVGASGGTNLGTTTTCSDSSDVINVAQGALVAMQITSPASTTAFSALPKVTASFTSTGGQQSPINLGYGLPSTTVQNFLGPLNTWQTTDALAQWVMPAAGTINNLFAQMSAAAGASKGWVFTVFQNGVATAIVAGDATHCGGASSVQCSDTSHSITVAALDTVSVQSCPSAISPPTGCSLIGTGAPAATNGTTTLNFTPTTANQAIILGVPTTNPPTTTTPNFTTLAGGWLAAGTQENLQQNAVPVIGSGMTLGNLTVAQCPGPGAGVTRTVTLRDTTVSKTPTATVAAGTTACPTLSTIQDTTHTYAANSASLLNFTTAPSGTSTALTEFKTSMTVTVP